MTGRIPICPVVSYSRGFIHEVSVNQNRHLDWSELAALGRELSSLRETTPIDSLVFHVDDSRDILTQARVSASQWLSSLLQALRPRRLHIDLREQEYLQGEDSVAPSLARLLSQLPAPIVSLSCTGNSGPLETFVRGLSDVLPRLEHLRLSIQFGQTVFDNTLPDLGRPKRLRNLELDGIDVGPTLTAWLARLRRGSLRRLTVSGLSSGTSRVDFIDSLATLPLSGLEELWLDDNSFDDAEVGRLGDALRGRDAPRGLNLLSLRNNQAGYRSFDRFLDRGAFPWLELLRVGKYVRDIDYRPWTLDRKNCGLRELLERSGGRVIA